MSQSVDRPGGKLVVEAPHWTAQITVFDYLSVKVAGGIGTLDKPLPAGLYTVVVKLAEEEHRQLVALEPDSEYVVSADSWKLSPLRKAPVFGRSGMRDPQLSGAEEASHKQTYKGREGSGRVFVFLRATDEGDAEALAKGVSLLDERGEKVTDFRRGVERDTESGYLAFSTDVRPGFYQLRAHERKGRSKHQGLWVCAGYETQLFVPVGKRVMLPAATMQMVPRGTGFDSSNDALYAAEALLDILGRGRLGDVGADMSGMDIDVRENPWIGILAATLWSAADPDASGLKVLLGQLMDVVPNHADVRALQADRDERVAEPFPFPPILSANFDRVLALAGKNYETVQSDSLTARILEARRDHGAWLAWADLPRQRSAESSSEDRASSQWSDGILEAMRRLAERITLDPDQQQPQMMLGQQERTPPVEEVSSDLNLPLSVTEAALKEIASAPEVIVRQQKLPPTVRKVSNYVGRRKVEEMIRPSAGEREFATRELRRRLHVAAGGLRAIANREEKNGEALHDLSARILESVNVLRYREGGILVLDQDERVKFASSACELLTGFKKRGLTGRDPKSHMLVRRLSESDRGVRMVDLPTRGETSTRLRLGKVSVHVSGGDDVFAYLFKLRRADDAAVDRLLYQQLDSLTNSISLYVTMMEHGEQRDLEERYRSELNVAIDKLDRIVEMVGTGGTWPPAEADGAEA